MKEVHHAVLKMCIQRWPCLSVVHSTCTLIGAELKLYKPQCVLSPHYLINLPSEVSNQCQATYLSDLSITSVDLWLHLFSPFQWCFQVQAIFVGDLTSFPSSVLWQSCPLYSYITRMLSKRSLSHHKTVQQASQVPLRHCESYSSFKCLLLPILGSVHQYSNYLSLSKLRTVHTCVLFSSTSFTYTYSMIDNLNEGG